MINNTSAVIVDITDAIPEITTQIDVIVGWCVVIAFTLLFFYVLGYLAKFVK